MQVSAPKPPAGFVLNRFGLHADAFGTRLYTQASDAGVSNPKPANGGPANGVTASSGTKICKCVWARTPLSFARAILDAGVITLPCGNLGCAILAKFAFTVSSI